MRKHQVVKAAPRPRVVGTDRGLGFFLSRGTHQAAAHAGAVVLQVEAAVVLHAQLRLPHTQALAAGGGEVVELFGQLRANDLAPAIVVGCGAPVGAGELVDALELQLAHRAPANAGHAVVRVFERQARAVVGAAAHADHHFLPFGLAQLHHHGQGVAIGGGLDVHEHRVVVTALGNAALRVLQLLQVVVAARRQAREAHQALGGHGVVALGALHQHVAHAHGLAGIQLDVEPRLVRLRVDVGQAVLHAARGVALCDQAAQRSGLGAVPVGLREGQAGNQAGLALDVGALLLGLRGGGDVAHEGHRDRGHLRDRARVDLDGDGAQRGRRGVAVDTACVGRCVTQAGRRHDLDAGRKVPQRGEQLAQVGGCLRQQTAEFVGIEVAQFAVALHFHVAQQEVAHGIGRLHVDLEARAGGGSCCARTARLGAVVRCVAGGVVCVGRALGHVEHRGC